MRNTRALMMLVAAILLGLAAVLVARIWMVRNTAPAGNQIVVAAADVSLGQRLRRDMLRMADWPKASVPNGATQDLEKLVGRVLKTSLMRDDPVTEMKLAPFGTMGGMSAVIADGKRAITVRVNDVVGVAGFALPGNFVDIIVNTQRDNKALERTTKEQAISKIVLERILVLAVAQEVGRDDTKPRVVNAVTLEVTPEQAEHVDLARSVGSLSLVLRNQVDLTVVHAPFDLKGLVGAGATKVTLLAEGPPPRPPPVRKAPAAHKSAEGPARFCVGVIDGLRSSQECL